MAGVLVGLVGGWLAARGAAIDGRATLATMILVASLDALVGLGAGCVVGVGVRLRRWGTLAAPDRGWRARGVPLFLAGAGAAAVAILAVVGTATRVNRLLAGLVVASASAGAVVLLTWLLPALSRGLARTPARAPQDAAPEPTRPAGAEPAAAAALGLLALVGVELAVALIVWRTRAPLRRAALLERAAWIGALSGLAPAVITAAASRVRRLRAPYRLRLALAITLGLAGGAAALLVIRWEKDFQFVPLRHLLTGIALGAVALTLVRTWPPVKRPGATLATLALLAVLGVLIAAESEPARKAAITHAGLAEPLLAAAGRALDRDHDGFARWLGGGDCADGDPAINPAALDEPGDHIDQDCDGEDADARALEARPFAAVPPGVPADLNLLLVAIDTLRADHLGAYGYRRPTSPVLDRLAAQGALFENAWAHAPSTRYSMPAIVTGRYPTSIEWQDCTGCASWWPRFSSAHVTIGQALDRIGFLTAALWAYSYFDAREQRGFERGIDHYDSQRAALHTNVAGPAESVGSSAREITDDAIAFLRAHPGERFFLSVHYYDPHLSYEAHAGAPAFGERPEDRYDQEIWFVDQQIGRLLGELQALGTRARTAVVVTGDHGEGFGERGVTAHGYHLYPPQTKVPLIIQVPGLPPRRIATPVGHVDLAPTLVNLVGGASEPSFLGRTLVGALAGAAPAGGDEVVFQEVSYEGDNKKRALVSATHQLIWNWTPHNTTECYDLTSGGLDSPDLWGSAAGEPECGRLKRRLRSMVALFERAARQPGDR